MKIKERINTFSHTKAGYYLLYTFLFILACFLVFFVFIQNDKGFIWVKGVGDGYSQHYTSLMYLGQWGREILKNIFVEHNFTVPLWDFSIGYGADIITSMHYYAIGDPLNLLSVAVPSEYTEYLYNFLVLLRFYLAGITFSLFSFKMNKSKWGTLAGAFVYVFSGFMIIAGIRHPFFVNPLIYLPLVLLGAEKILRKESFYVFVLSVCLCAVSNFYFFYMIVIATIIYVAVRYFTMHREKSLKDAFITIGKFMSLGLLGTLMAAVIFVPVISVLLYSGRIGNEQIIEMFYNSNYYRNLFTSSFITPTAESWMILGFSAPAFVSFITLIIGNKKHKGIKIGFIILAIISLIPFLGKAMNGFSYISNRWCFIIAALVAFTVATMWESMFTLSKKKFLWLSSLTVIYFGLVLLLEKQNRKAALLSFVFVCISLSLIWIYKNLNISLLLKRAMCFSLVSVIILSCGVNAYFKYSGNNGNYVSEFMKTGKALKGINKSSDSIMKKYASEKDFSRYEQTKVSNLNASTITKTYGIQYYWSLENGYSGKFFSENAINSFKPQMFQTINSRAYLDALASVKYYLDAEEGIVPFGFEKIDEVKKNKKKYSVYENNYSLPLGYTYSSYITKDDYNKMDAAQKQQAMLQGVVVEDSSLVKNYEKTNPVYSHKTENPTVTPNKKVGILKDGSFVVNNKNSSITLSFNGMKNCETYLSIEGIDFEPKNKYQLYMDDCKKYYSKNKFSKLSEKQQEKLKSLPEPNKRKKKNSALVLGVASGGKKTKIQYATDFYRYSSVNNNYFVNVGYSKKARNTITLTFPVVGVYKIGNISVVHQPMENYTTQINLLKEDIMTNEKIETNKVSGEISLNENKILAFSVPYSKGWKAYVDGKETEILKANTMYMALPLEKGQHKITLKYRTPLLRESVIVSVFALIIFICLSITYTKIKKKRLS